MEKDLPGKAVTVTGAASGIGQATALLYGNSWSKSSGIRHS